MTRLDWQLPWAGPRLTDPEAPSWSVMPSPRQGNAVAVCVAVRTVRGQVELALAAQPTASIPTANAPLDIWTEVRAAPGTAHGGFLCLVGHDLVTLDGRATPFRAALPSRVALDELGAALVALQHDGLSLVDYVLQDPRLMGPARPNPAAAAAPGSAASKGSANASIAFAAPPSGRSGDASLPAALTLAFASCQYSAGLLDALPAQASLQRLADRLDHPTLPQPQRLLLLGDQIYADATAGLLDPARLADRYRLPYEELLRVAPLRRIMGRIPISYMLDDHEIVDNWEPFVQGATGKRYRRGLDAYWRYQRGDHRPPGQRGQGGDDTTWFTVPGNGWELFGADTRTERDARSEATLEQAEILGAAQRGALESWLTQLPRDDLKLVAAPAMLLPRVLDGLEEPLHLDNWQGYPASLHRLLALICDEQIDHVVYLSGDAHLSCDARITVLGPDGKTARLRALHAPALYAPLPFANEQVWNLAMPRDRFTFTQHGRTYRCSVAAAPLPRTRDGSCLLHADRDRTGRWKIRCELV